MPPLRSVTAAARAPYDIPLVLRTADPVLASDDDLRIVLWNKGAEDLLGFAASEVLGMPCCELIGCHDGATALRFRCGCRELLDGAGLPPACERQLRTKSGGQVWVNVTTIVTLSQAGLSVLVHLLRDVSPKREMEEALRRVASGAARLALHPAPEPGREDSQRSEVTAREREVIRLLAQGVSTEAIAATLAISQRTARNHIQNILSKLGVHSRLQAVAYASNRGLV